MSYNTEIMRDKVERIHGHCLVHYESKTIFIPIPKNGSQTMKLSIDGIIEYNRLHPYENGNYFSLIKEKPEMNNWFKFSVIRDPVERFISSFCQFMPLVVFPNKETPKLHKEAAFYKEPNLERKFMRFLNDVISGVIIDEHVEKQIYFITDKKTKKFFVENFVLMNRFERELKDISKKRNFNLFIRSSNVSMNRMPHIVKKIKSLVNSDSRIAKKIIDFYVEDYMLYEKIKKERMS